MLVKACEGIFVNVIYKDEHKGVSFELYFE